MEAGRARPRVGMYRERPGSDVQQTGYFKKLKTMKKKFFVLRSTSSSGAARLDYHDSEKKYKSGHPPKRSILLHSCFNINKKNDTKHRFVLSLYTNDDCFSLVMDNEEQQETWLNSLLEFQNEYLLEGQAPKIHYDHVWQGVIKPKGQKATLEIHGTYRLCLSSKSVSLVRPNSDVPEYTFQFSSIRRCGHSDNFFFMEVGRSSVTGSGELWMQVDDTAIAQSMHDAVLVDMTAARNNNPDAFRRRSNTGSSAVVHHRNTVVGDEPFHRKRTASESHPHGSPRRCRPQPDKRPMSTAGYSRSVSQVSPITIGSSPLSAFDHSFLEDPRLRSDSMGSHSSRTSSHSTKLDHTLDGTPVVTPEGSYISCRSMTPEATYSMPAEDHQDGSYMPMTPEQHADMADYMPPDQAPAMTDYLDMNPDRRPATDYLPMTPGTPGHRSGTPSPTRDRIERPGSAASGDSQESTSRMDGYMDMRPGSSVGSNGNDSGYIDMTPAPKPPLEGGYMVMGPGARTTAPIAIRPPNKDGGGYMDMVPASQSQTLPTVKESGSGEAYLPMTPTGQSPISSAGLKPAKVISYLSDDSMSGEFPKRAYSVGSRPTQKTYRNHQMHETHRRPVLDNSRSSSAPHLIIQKSRSPYLDMKNPYESSLASSPLSQSYKSDDSDSFMEIDFYRPRTASDSYGYRPRSSSFGKQYTSQGHRPRSSSYGQSSRGKLASKLAMSRVDSYESVRMTSHELRRRSQDSLEKFSSSSRNSSSDSLKKLPEEVQQKTNYLKSGYMDMAFDKHKVPSPNTSGVSSPKPDGTSYVDMTLGTSTPKSSRGISPSSSSHSLGSSPVLASHIHHHDKPQDVVVVKASGHMVHKPGFSSQQVDGPGMSNQLQVGNSRRTGLEKHSPSSSGRESEDESYVPFQPATSTSPKVVQQQQKSHTHPFGHSHGLSPEVHAPAGPLNHPGLKVHHGYSRSYDSAIRSPDHINKKGHSKGDKSRKDDKHRDDKHKRHKDVKQADKNKESESKDNWRASKENVAATSHALKSEKPRKGEPKVQEVSLSLIDKVSKGNSPTLERKMETVEFIPDTDIFSNKPYSDEAKPKVELIATPSMDESSYMEYLPGFDVPQIPKAGPVVVKPRIGSISEYMEIDPADVEDLSEKYRSASDKAQSPKTPTSAKIVDKDTFQYMDFDPSRLQQELEKEFEPIKMPVRVQSFISQNRSQVGRDENKSEKTESVSSRTSNIAAIQSEKTTPNEDSGAKTSSECAGAGDKDIGDKSNTNTTSAGVETQPDGQGCATTAKETFENVISERVEKIALSRENVEKCNVIKCDKKKNTVDCNLASADISDTSSKCQAGQRDNCEGQANLSSARDKNVDVSSDKKVVVQTDIGCVGDECPPSQEACGRDSCQVTHGTAGRESGNTCPSSVGDAHDKSDKAIASRSHSLDEPVHKIVIKKSLSAKAIGTFHVAEQMMDEGYVDLDFSDKGDKQMERVFQSTAHKRSCSSSSTNSEKSRSLADFPLNEEDDIPCPETPISYISEDPETEMEGIIRYPESSRSYIFDDTTGGSKVPAETGDAAAMSRVETGSPFKQVSSTGRMRVKSGQKGGGIPPGAVTAGGDNARKSFPLRSGQIPSPVNTGLSRQTSAPAVPSYSPRTGAEIQSNRNRKTSGPPDFPSCSKGWTGNPNLPKRQCMSDSGVLGQELIKQASMPAMAIPAILQMEQTSVSANLQDTAASRHSFTDLSDYVSMNFPADLSNTGQVKSSSQQQLSEPSQEQQAALNYAQLDIGGSSENIEDKSPRTKSRHPSSIDDLSQLTSPISYAEIDYQKTENLKNSGNKDVKFTL